MQDSEGQCSQETRILQFAEIEVKNTLQELIRTSEDRMYMIGNYYYWNCFSCKASTNTHTSDRKLLAIAFDQLLWVIMQSKSVLCLSLWCCYYNINATRLLIIMHQYFSLAVLEIWGQAILRMSLKSRDFLLPLTPALNSLNPSQLNWVCSSFW